MGPRRPAVPAVDECLPLTTHGEPAIAGNGKTDGGKPVAGLRDVTPRTCIMMWLEGFLLAGLVGIVAVWIGLAGIPLTLALLAFLALTPDGRKRAAGGLVGLGSGVGVLTGYAMMSCAASLHSGPSSCIGPDWRPVFVLAALSLVLGVILTIRRRIP